MRKFVALLLPLIVLSSCDSRVSKEDMQKINGYWQIEKVVDGDGNEKDFQANTSYDYFEVRDLIGIRKKVMPQLDGTFLTNNLVETVKVVYEKDATYLDFSTAYAKWREKILKLTDSELVLRNEEKLEYHYKKAGPIKLEGNGETQQ